MWHCSKEYVCKQLCLVGEDKIQRELDGVILNEKLFKLLMLIQYLEA